MASMWASQGSTGMMSSMGGGLTIIPSNGGMSRETPPIAHSGPAGFTELGFSLMALAQPQLTLPTTSNLNEPMPIMFGASGKVTFNNNKYGFVMLDEDPLDVGSHGLIVIPSVCPMRKIPPVGTRVTFDVVPDPKSARPRASNLNIAVGETLLNVDDGYTVDIESFIGRWGLEEAAVKLLYSLEPDIQQEVMSKFAPKNGPASVATCKEEMERPPDGIFLVFARGMVNKKRDDALKGKGKGGCGCGSWDYGGKAGKGGKGKSDLMFKFFEWMMEGGSDGWDGATGGSDGWDGASGAGGWDGAGGGGASAAFGGGCAAGYQPY